MFKTLRTPLILFLLSSPLIFLDLYSKHLAHKHITSEDKKIVLTEDIELVVPMINKGWGAHLQPSDTITNWSTITRNIALAFLCIFFLMGALAGDNIYETVSSTVYRAGLLGNSIDAFFLDGVTDFIKIYTNAEGTMYVANLADIFITVGMIAYFISFLSPIFYDYIRLKI